MHLPLRVEGRYAEAEALTRAAVAVIPGTLWLSHLPPDEASQLAARRGRSRWPCGCGSAPGSGWVTRRTGRPWPRCSTCTPYAGASGRATADGWCRPTGGSWWWPAAPPTASGWRRRRPRSPCGSGRSRWRRVSGGGRPGPQPVHDQREEALVPGAAAHAVEPAVPAPQGDAAGHRGRGAGRAAADHGHRGPGGLGPLGSFPVLAPQGSLGPTSRCRDGPTPAARGPELAMRGLGLGGAGASRAAWPGAGRCPRPSSPSGRAAPRPRRSLLDVVEEGGHRLGAAEVGRDRSAAEVVGVRRRGQQPGHHPFHPLRAGDVVGHHCLPLDPGQRQRQGDHRPCRSFPAAQCTRAAPGAYATARRAASTESGRSTR